MIKVDKDTHLIVGAGNMGQRHARALAAIDEKIALVDAGFEEFEVKEAKSILICTPPESHANLIALYGSALPNIPIFVEKPVITEIGQLRDYKLPKTSMVACNWRWCRCYSTINVVECGYNYSDEFGYLDMVHFLDLFWERYGKPEKVELVENPGIIEMIVGCDERDIRAVIRKSRTPYTEFNGEIIHRDMCNMFFEQMRTWVDVCDGRIKSPNPIEHAVEVTEWLLSARQKKRPIGYARA